MILVLILFVLMNNQLRTDRWFPIPEKALNHPVQTQLKKDLFKKKYTEYIIPAGRRSFKTERFIKRRSIVSLNEGTNRNIFVGAPTRIQAKGIFWKDLKALCPAWLKGKVSESELSITSSTGNNLLQVIGLQEFKRIQGMLCHEVLISEYQECDPDVWYESFYPMINDTDGIAIKEGRPIGKNHFYDEYLAGLIPNNKIKSYHWTSEDILSTEQIKDAKSRLGKSDYQREYLASFETDSQSPYYAYSNQNHRTAELRNDIPFILACDFNATTKPMSWIFGQRIKDNFSDVTYWKKTFSNKFTNTQTQCEIVWEYFQTLENKSNTLLLYGDYSGKAKESNSSYSDWEIIQNFFRNKFTNIEQRTKPTKSIRDSISSTNAQLCNMLGERKQFVNELTCKELIDDWNKCEWKPNGRELDETNDDRGHMCRAVDYYNDYEFPVKGKPISKWSN